MKKTITKILCTAALSISPALSTEDGKDSGERRVFFTSQRWENGKMLWEKIEYAPEAPKFISPPSGMRVWESMAMNTPVQCPLPLPKPTPRSGMGVWENMAMNPIIQNSSTIVYYGQNDGW